MSSYALKRYNERMREKKREEAIAFRKAMRAPIIDMRMIIKLEVGQHLEIKDSDLTPEGKISIRNMVARTKKKYTRNLTTRHDKKDGHIIFIVERNYSDAEEYQSEINRRLNEKMKQE